MHPPADPWDPEGEPTVPRMYGRAPIPTPPAIREPTAEMPPFEPLPRPTRAARPVSWQRSSRPALRSLADGWGFTATGLVVGFCGWGFWAAAGRGAISAPYLGLLFMLFVGAGVFVLSRFFGYIVVEQTLRRPRLHARWAHLLTGLFLTVAGISYIANTSWLVEGIDWLRDQWQKYL
jgi:eukaryotic-like serine/threonine-protein kinase